MNDPICFVRVIGRKHRFRLSGGKRICARFVNTGLGFPDGLREKVGALQPKLHLCLVKRRFTQPACALAQRFFAAFDYYSARILYHRGTRAVFDLGGGEAKASACCGRDQNSAQAAARCAYGHLP